MTETTGWAVMASGAKIFVRSVSETRRAAIINWLVTEKNQMVTNYHTDADIEAMWQHFGQYVDCREVTIAALTSNPAGKGVEKP